jgi:hypothetical protein
VVSAKTNNLQMSASTFPGHHDLRHRRVRRRQVDLIIETLYKA